MSKVIIKRCTPLGSKCTPHRPFVKWYRGVKRKRLHGDHFRITAEPAFVKRYIKTLTNRDFCKKKLDTRFDTHRIKTGVQLWQGMRDSNPRKRSQSPVCYRYTNPLYFGSDTEQRLLLYAEPAKCQEEISNFARIFFRRLLLRRNWEPGIV